MKRQPVCERGAKTALSLFWKLGLQGRLLEITRIGTITTGGGIYGRVVWCRFARGLY
jgi:hypothetical protein